MRANNKNTRILILISIIILIIFLNSSNLKPIQNSSIPIREVPISADQLIKVPHHYQINDYYCGPAALQMIFDYYGALISQNEIAEVARTDDYEGGTFWFELRRAAHFSDFSISRGRVLSEHINGYSKRKLGYTAFSMNLNNATCLKKILDMGYPILIITWSSLAKQYKHFRVVVGYTIEEDRITNFILNDPAIGPNYHMEYNYFIELWESNTNWSLFVSPWEMSISYPSTINSGSSFFVNATIKYPCPLYFDNTEYNAKECSASINLPDGFYLTKGVNRTIILNNGTMGANSSEFCQWNVTSGEMNTIGRFSIEAKGKIRGSVSPHYIYLQYSYFDYIGNIKAFSIEIVGGTSFDIPIVILSISLGGLVVGSASYVLLKKRKSESH